MVDVRSVDRVVVVVGGGYRDNGIQLIRRRAAAGDNDPQVGIRRCPTLPLSLPPLRLVLLEC